MPRKSRKSNKKTNKRTGGTRMPFQSPKYKRAAEELEQNQQNQQNQQKQNQQKQNQQQQNQQQQNQQQNSTPPYDYSQENNQTLSVPTMANTSIHEQQQKPQEQENPRQRELDKIYVEGAIDDMEENAVKSRKKQQNQQQQQQQQPAPTPALDKDTLEVVKDFIGGKKVRKHRGIVQTGGKAGKLRKGYKYTGRRLKNGQAEIKKVKSKK